MNNDWPTAPEWAQWCVTLSFGPRFIGLFTDAEPTLTANGWRRPGGRVWYDLDMEGWPGSNVPWRESKRRRPI